MPLLRTKPQALLLNLKKKGVEFSFDGVRPGYQPLAA